MFRASHPNRVPSAAIAAMLVLSSCGLEPPVSITNRPLAEQLDQQRTEQTSVSAANGANASVAPESLAFSEALADGAFVRLHITNDGVPASLRSGPGSAYDQLSEVPSGSEVLATGNQTGEWVHVMYADFDGWVTTRRISFDSGEGGGDQIIAAADVDRSPVTYVVIGEAVGVNIRAEADAASALVSGAAVGSQVVGTGNTEGAWVEVIFDGVTGWAAGNYLEPAGPASSTVTSTTVGPTQNVDE